MGNGVSVQCENESGNAKVAYYAQQWSKAELDHSPAAIGITTLTTNHQRCTIQLCTSSRLFSSLAFRRTVSQNMMLFERTVQT